MMAIGALLVLVLVVVVLAVVLPLTVFWVWALRDVLVHEGGATGQRVRWLLLVGLLWAPGALTYCLVRRRQRRDTLRAAGFRD